MGTPPMGADTRRQRRMAVGLEVRIRGTDRYGRPFDETTVSSNVSRGGCSVQTAREVALGSALEIEILRRVPGRGGLIPFVTTGVLMRTTQMEPDFYTLGIQFTGPQFPTYSSEEPASGSR